ncbi:hypothetical protein KCP69_11525 [Salmonella enterica subsp. enterica]|nr:hypothetical protein KCP69_11525 [Salmonella enterica subsp. enterica]
MTSSKRRSKNGSLFLLASGRVDVPQINITIIRRCQTRKTSSSATSNTTERCWIPFRGRSPNVRPAPLISIPELERG